MPGDARPQLRAAKRFGIADFAAIKRRDGSVPDGARRRRARFANLQMDDVLSFARPAGGTCQHIQGHERRDIGSARQRAPRDGSTGEGSFVIWFGLELGQVAQAADFGRWRWFPAPGTFSWDRRCFIDSANSQEDG